MKKSNSENSNMVTNDKDNSLDESVAKALDRSIENLSPDIRRRLNQARISALGNKPRSSYFIKAASTFSFAIALAIAWQLMPNEKVNMDTPFAEVLQEDLELIEQLDFIYWMTEEKESAQL
jgi:uncharacterized protein DUF3619